MPDTRAGFIEDNMNDQILFSLLKKKKKKKKKKLFVEFVSHVDYII